MIKEIIERNREEVDEIKKQMITSNAKEGGNVYQILRHAK